MCPPQVKSFEPSNAQSVTGPIREMGKRKLLLNPCNFLCMLGGVYIIILSLKNYLILLAKVFTSSKNTHNSKLVRTSLLMLIFVVIWSVTPTFYFIYFICTLKRAWVLF